MGGIQLLDLPVELLQPICTFVRAPSHLLAYYDDSEKRNGLKSLSALSRTCRLLHSIALPMLFHRLEESGVLLLRTLVARPDLAATVRILRLNFWAFQGNDELFEAALSGTEIEPPDKCEPQQYEGEDEDDEVRARVADAILAHLPQLEELEYTLGDWVMGRTLSERRVFLSRLKRLHVWYHDTEGGFNLGDLAIPFQVAHKLEHLVVSMCYEIPPGLPLANLKSVTLSSSLLAATDLQNLVGASPKLESFSYSSGGSMVSLYASNWEEEAMPRQIQRALWPRRHIIRYLDFDFAQNGDYLSAEGDDFLRNDEDYLESFTGFTSLETLIVSQRWLPSFKADRVEPLIEMLPESLRVLSITDRAGEDHAYNGLLELSDAVAEGQLPNLKRIDFDQSGPEAEEIRERFSAANVECRNYIPDYMLLLRD